MALDKVSAAMMSPLSVSETAPSNPAVGQRWYRASTAVTYQYTNDGTSSFWYRKGVKHGIHHALMLLKLDQHQINTLNTELKKDSLEISKGMSRNVKYN